MLLVATREEDAERFGAVLSEAGAVDLDELERTWKEAGWKGYDGPTASTAGEHGRSTRSANVKLY